jgi:hypothetical protein
MSASGFHDTGVHFDNGYESEGLARVLELVIAHQNAFAAPRNLIRPGLLQIATPTQQETSAATASVSEASTLIATAISLIDDRRIARERRKTRKSGFRVTRF